MEFHCAFLQWELLNSPIMEFHCAFLQWDLLNPHFYIVYFPIMEFTHFPLDIVYSCYGIPIQV